MVGERSYDRVNGRCVPCVKELLESDQARQAGLQECEIVAVVLYTGPMVRPEGPEGSHPRLPARRRACSQGPPPGRAPLAAPRARATVRRLAPRGSRPPLRSESGAAGSAGQNGRRNRNERAPSPAQRAEPPPLPPARQFQVYNTVLRRWPRDEYEALEAGGNLFATTIHVLVSAVHKVRRRRRRRARREGHARRGRGRREGVCGDGGALDCARSPRCAAAGPPATPPMARAPPGRGAGG